MSLKYLQYRKTNHIGHFLLTLLTGGFWIIPWIIFAICNNNYNQRIDLAHMVSQSNNNRNNNGGN